MTAVEWFFKQLTEVDYGCINKTFLQNNNSLAGHKLRELLEQAKEMENSQATDYAKWSMDTSQLTGRFFTFLEWIKDEPKNDDNL